MYQVDRSPNIHIPILIKYDCISTKTSLSRRPADNIDDLLHGMGLRCVHVGIWTRCHSDWWNRMNQFHHHEAFMRVQSSRLVLSDAVDSFSSPSKVNFNILMKFLLFFLLLMCPIRRSVPETSSDGNRLLHAVREDRKLGIAPLRSCPTGYSRNKNSKCRPDFNIRSPRLRIFDDYDMKKLLADCLQLLKYLGLLLHVNYAQ